MQPYSTTKVTLQEGLRSPKKWKHVTAARDIHTLYRILLVVQAKNSPSNHSILHLSLRSRLFLRKTRLFIRTCSKQNRNGMKWNPNRMKHATMCNLFLVILKNFFVKTQTGRKPIEEVLCLGSNTPQVPSWVTGNSAILGGVGILQKRAWSLVIHFDQLQVWSLHL